MFFDSKNIPTLLSMNRTCVIAKEIRCRGVNYQVFFIKTVQKYRFVNIILKILIAPENLRWFLDLI
jgi:hypothetical protein